MMRIQEGWFPIALAVLCLLLLGSAGVRSQEISNSGQLTDADDVPGVKPLDADGASRKATTEKPALEAKSVGPESPDAKPTNEAKKKTITDFGKPKPELKYQKTKDAKVIGDTEITTAITTSDFATTIITTTPSSNGIVEEMTTTEKPAENNAMIDLPLLLHGEPILQTTSSTTITEETTSIKSGSRSGEPITASAKKEEPSTITSVNASSRARALNVSAPEPTNTLHSKSTDLSDVSMDDEDKEVEGGEYIAMHNVTSVNVTVNPLPKAVSVCMDGNNTYSVGETIKRGCEEECLCGEGGKIMNCEPMCKTPFVRSGRKHNDPFCHARELPENPCCSILMCTDSSPEPDETCVFGNTTVARGQIVEDGCSKSCICEAGGHLKCQPRCPPNDTVSGVSQHDRCVVLQDPNDPCCSITLCDVTLGDHEIKPDTPADMNVNLTDVKVLNSTAIKLKLSSKSLDDVVIEISENNHVWTQVNPTKDGIINNLQPAHGYYVRIVEGSRAGPAIHVSMLAEVTKTGVTEKSEKGTCSHRGKSYKIGAEWYDECLSVCFCNETAQTECVTIVCPTDFGLDVLDPHCLDWETVPPNHVPKAPNCCPQEVRCRNNGSCAYEGKNYENWSRLPTNVTGCEKECYCEFGNVTCNTVCPPVSQYPPNNLNCKQQEAILTHMPGDECCLHWACAPPNLPGFEHGISPIGQFPSVLGHGNANLPNQQAYEISVEDLRAVSANTIRLMFTVPSVLVGLHGRVEVRYTSDKSNIDPSTWKSQTFAPPGDLIDTEDLEFDLSGLKPSTVYRLMIVVKLRDLSNMHTSKIYQVRTLDKQAPSSMPTDVNIDSQLKVVDVNSTFAEFEWKKFTNYELQFIDGIYLMYRAEDDKTYSVTPLLHRSVNHYVLDHLRPSTIYEVRLSTKDIIGQANVLIDSKTVNFTTAAESDPYSFDIKVEIKTIKSTDVEVSWSGVPQPQDKYVNIYRAVYQSDSGKEDTSTFKIPKKDSSTKTIISDLKPGTRYRLWLEVYLTNGKIKKSNVRDFVTKPGVLLPPGASQQQGKLASISLHEGDYYGPLVIVAIVASLAILSTLILLMMLMKRRTSSKADISPRKTTSAYDNPSYKVELQQETMDL